jgi:DNA repair protein RadC
MRTGLSVLWQSLKFIHSANTQKQMKQQTLFEPLLPIGVPERSLDKPFEKIAYGTALLNNRELLAILIGEEAAGAVMKKVDCSLQDLGRVSMRQLAQLPGMTMRKAAMVISVMELGRRKACEEVINRQIVASSADVAAYMQNLIADLNHEVFVVMFLTRSNKILKVSQLSSGGINGTVADPKIIMKEALEVGASCMILCHNHPSGSLRPSRADEEVTANLKQAAKYFDMKVLDHLIVAQTGYYSFADEGIM